MKGRLASHASLDLLGSLLFEKQMKSLKDLQEARTAHKKLSKSRRKPLEATAPEPKSRPRKATDREATGSHRKPLHWNRNRGHKEATDREATGMLGTGAEIDRGQKDATDREATGSHGSHSTEAEIDVTRKPQTGKPEEATAPEPKSRT